MSNHGGFRLGSGRPSAEPTKQVRVPLGAEQLVKDILKLYRSDDPKVVKLLLDIHQQLRDC